MLLSRGCVKVCGKRECERRREDEGRRNGRRKREFGRYLMVLPDGEAEIRVTVLPCTSSPRAGEEIARGEISDTEQQVPDPWGGEG